MVKDFSIRRIPGSFRFALRGILNVLRSEQNVQIHAVVAIAAITLSIVLKISTVEFALILLATGLVLGAEILNTVIEDFLDVLHPDHHGAIRRIKDALAGAVLLSALIAVSIGFLIFAPPLVELLK